MIKIIDRVVDKEVRDFVDRQEMSNYLNDEFGIAGTALKLELYMKGGETEVFYLAPINQEETMVFRGDKMEYESDPDSWIELVINYIHPNEINAYRSYNDYSIQILIERN